MYLSIASYRDQFLQSTIDSAFSNAAYPEKLRVGVFIQIINSDVNKNNHLITNNYNGAVNYKIEEAGNIFSVSYCRTAANYWLKESDKYVLQIDAHSRFLKDWDKKLIEIYQSVSDNRVILSSYLPGWYSYQNTESIIDTIEDYASVADYDKDNCRRSFINTYEIIPYIYNTICKDLAICSWHTCGHFVFSTSEYFLNVKQPDWILFWGEELYHSLIAYTHGWNVYSPKNPPVRHLYPQDVKKFSSEIVLNKLWKDFPEEWIKRKISSTDAVIDAIISKKTGPNYLGTERSIDDLYKLLNYDIGKFYEKWRNDYREIY